MDIDLMHKHGENEGQEFTAREVMMCGTCSAGQHAETNAWVSCETCEGSL